MGRWVTGVMRASVGCTVLALLATLAAGQAGGPPEWIEKLDPTKYILLARDLKPPFAWGTDPVIEAQGQSVGLDDGKGNVTQQTTFFAYSVQTVKLAPPFANTAATNPPTPMRWDMDWTMTVGIYQNEEVAKAAVRTHYLSVAGPFTTEDENCLKDGRLRGGRGAAGAMGRFVRYRNLLLKIDMGQCLEVKSNRPKMDFDLWNGAHGRAQTHQQNLIAKLAALWLDKVAGPDRADLHLDPTEVCLRLWEVHRDVEREPAADQQYVYVPVNNRSDKVAAVGAEARLLLAKPGDAEFQPISRPVRLPDIPPGGWKPAVFYWDLGGKNVEDVLLRVQVEIPGIEDADLADNHCDLKCSIYYAHSGSGPFRWVEDSYSFGNYGFEDREGQEMLEGVLATAIGQLYTDPQAATIVTRLIFPQTYIRFVSYLQSSMKEGAGGHCYGLCATAGLYFLDASLRPGAGRTCDLTKDAASPNVNIYQRAQMVPLVQALISGDEYFGRNWGGVQCLNTVRDRLKTQRKPVILSIGGTKQVPEQVIVNGAPQVQQVAKWWGHALLAYKLVEVEGRPSAVYLYDPNIPPKGQWGGQNPSTAFGINRTTGGWVMTPNMTPWYGGVSRLAAREVAREVPLAEANALVAAIKAKLAEVRSWFDKAGKIMAVLHCPADALFTDPQGRRVGMLSGKPINEVPGAEIRASGEVEIYVLPRDVPFTVQVTGTGAGQANLDLLRSSAGTLEVAMFSKVPVTAGGRLQGTVAAGGALAQMTAADGRAYQPTVGKLQGDKVTWQGGSQTGLGPTGGPGPTTGPGPATGPTSGQAVELIICESAPGGQPQGIANEFTAPKRVTALVRYTSLPANTTVQFVWTRGSQQQAELTKALSGTGWQSHGLTATTALTPGQYHLSLLVNGKSFAERDITVRAAGTGSTITPATKPPTPPLESFTLTGPSSVGTLATRYDRNRFGVRMGVIWSKPGTILDTIGINAAPAGSFSLLVDAAGKVHLQVYAPAHGSPYKTANGWHVLPSPVALAAGQYGEVTLTYEQGEWALRVLAGGQKQTVKTALPVPPSGEPIYVGDFPGDNNWPANLTPRRGLTGTVQVLGITGRIE